MDPRGHRRFRDRTEAGRELARQLTSYAGRPDVLVLALPRGGIPVAYEVATALDAPLDVFLVRKLGVPGHEELAMGAIALGGIRVLNEEVVRSLHISPQTIERVTASEQQELTRREHLYRGDREAPSLSGRTIILIDDGLATGSTMRAAAEAIRKRRPLRLVIAVPVAAARRVTSSETRWTRSCARSHRNRFTRWDSGTKTSRRRQTTTCASCSPAAHGNRIRPQAKRTNVRPLD
jgi:putative phosphoribosyl transferase